MLWEHGPINLLGSNSNLPNHHQNLLNVTHCIKRLKSMMVMFFHVLIWMMIWTTYYMLGLLAYQKEQSLEIEDWVQLLGPLANCPWVFLLNDLRVSACPLIKQKDNTIDDRVVLIYSSPLNNMGLNCAGLLILFSPPKYSIVLYFLFFMIFLITFISLA